jgi:3-oxoacyl-[acyl-carrier-protein] synthase III
MLRARIIGTGRHLPDKIVTNDDLAKHCDTTDEWVVQRTGIRQRHNVAPGEGTSDMAAPAAMKAIEAAGLEPKDIDLLFCCTTTPDQVVPATACRVQDKIGATNAAAMDVNAACSGFIYGVSLADAMIKTDQAKNIVVIGAEVASNRLSYERRETVVLFGDGAGAAVLTRSDNGRGVLTSHMWSDGSGLEMLWYPGGGSKIPATHDNLDDMDIHAVQMNGQGVFKRAVTDFSAAIHKALEKTGHSIDEVDIFIPHQANVRIINAVAQKVGIPEEKCIINLDRVGNLIAGSIPVALDEAVRDGRVKDGDLVLIAGFGAGLTWGSALIRW